MSGIRGARVREPKLGFEERRRGTDGQANGRMDEWTDGRALRRDWIRNGRWSIEAHHSIPFSSSPRTVSIWQSPSAPAFSLTVCFSFIVVPTLFLLRFLSSSHLLATSYLLFLTLSTSSFILPLFLIFISVPAFFYLFPFLACYISDSTLFSPLLLSLLFPLWSQYSPRSTS